MTKRAQLADGTTLEFPDETPDAVMDRVVRNHVAGGKPPQRKKDTRPTSFWQGVVEGFHPVAQNIDRIASNINPLMLAADALGLVDSAGTREKVSRRRQQQSASSPTRGSTAGRIAGNVIATAPTVMIPGGPAVQGAVAGALSTENPRDLRSLMMNTAAGAAGGKVGDVVGRKVIAPTVSAVTNALVQRGAKIMPRAAQRLLPKPVATAMSGQADNVASAMAGQADNAFTLSGQFTNAPRPSSGLSAVPEQLAPLGRAAAVRSARMKAAGISSPTTGMVTRDPRVWNFERESAKRYGLGDDMLNAIRQADEDIVSAAAKIVDDQGGSIGAEAAGSRVTKALSDKNENLRQGVSALYTQAREAMGDGSAGPLNKLREALDDPEMMDNPVFDAMRDGINRRLQRFGMAGESGLLRKDAVATISQAEELRKLVGNLGDSRDPAVRYMREKLISTIDDDVFGTVGDDAFGVARQAARERFSEFKGTFAGKLADEGVPPEKLTGRLLSQATPIKDLRALRRSLMTGTPDQIANGERAMQSIGAEALNDIFSKGVTPDGKVNGTTLFNQFMKNQDRLRVILSPQAYKQARRLVIAAREATADVPYSGVNYSNTTSAAANLFPDITASKGGMLPNMIRRGVGAVIGSTGGAPGAIAGDAVAQGMNDAIARRGVKATMNQALRQVELAKSPEAAAAALGQVADNEAVDMAVREFARTLSDAIGGGAGRALPPSVAAGAIAGLPRE